MPRLLSIKAEQARNSTSATFYLLDFKPTVTFIQARENNRSRKSHRDIIIKIKLKFYRTTVGLNFPAVATKSTRQLTRIHYTTFL